MSGFRTEGSEKPSEGRRMTPVAQASRLLQEIAEPRPVGDTVKAAITRAARAVSAVRKEPFSYGRCEDLWRCEARRVDASEMDAIREAYERRNRSVSEELREAAALADRLERLAAQFAPLDHLSATAEVRETARQAKRTARALRDLAEAGSPVGASL